MPLHTAFAAGTEVTLFGGMKAFGGADPCAGKDASECYQLLEPFGAFNEKNEPVEVTAIGLDANKTIGDTFNNIYFMTIGLASLVGVLLIAWYGFQYMRNDDNVSKNGVLKDKITNVVIGLLLLVSIYVILNTINPQLLDVQPDLDRVYLKASEDFYKDYIKTNNTNVSFKDFTQYIKSEYIPARDKALPNLSKGLKILITAHTQMEGFYPGSKSYRTKNPGNIGNIDNGATVTYPTLGEGIQAQYNYVKKIVDGNHLAYQMNKYNSGAGLTYTGTIDQYLKIYATGARTSDTYVNLVIAAFKQEGITITKQTTLKEIYNIK